MATKCENAGWLAPPSVPIVDVAWKRGEPVVGCSNLVCSRCGRRVVWFDREFVGKRPERGWCEIYDRNGWEELLSKDPKPDRFRSYFCGCSSFPAGSTREVDELQIDADLPWECAGHPATGGG
jgi:hypothetical protein